MKFVSGIAVLIVCLLISVECPAVKPPKRAALPEEPKPGAVVPESRPAELGPYLINVGDVIEIAVWRTKDMTRDVIVRPDGVISYPLVGDLKVAGITLTELGRRFTEKLKEFIRNPQVSVAIKKFGGTKVIVLGEVRAPGVYTPTGQGSVLEVVALAGGFTDDAVRSKTLLIRGGLEKPKPFALNLASTLLHGDQSQNPPLMPNDILYVPKNGAAKFNYVMKQIMPTLQNVLMGTSIANNLGYGGVTTRP